MPDFGSALWNKPTSGDTGEGGGGSSDPVTRSLRFDGSAYLSRSTGSTSTTWTLSFWVKRATISGPSQHQYLATWGISGSAGEGLVFRGTGDSSNTDKLMLWNGATSTYSSGVYRDPAAWAHICISVNSGTATVYYNGESVISGVSGIQAWGSMRLGAWLNQNELEGYLADIYGIEGSALDHTSFTESNDYGGLKPKEYTGAFGTNGFHLKFEDSSDIGADDAGSNDFNTSGLSSHDVMLDNPFKNHPTWNPLVNSSNTFTEGNLKVTTTSSTPAKIVSTIGASSGKWYAEVLYAGQNSFPLGITADNRERDYLGNSDGNTSISFWPGTAGTAVYINGSSVSFSGSSTTWASGDIIGIALNADDKEVSLYKNGSLVGAAVSYSSYNWTEAFFAAGNYSSGLVYHANFGADPNFAGGYTGTPASSEWAYSPPTGFKSLNSSNLTASVTPSEHFNTVLYNGTYDSYYGAGTSSQSITGVGFSPSIVWVKDRDNLSATYSNSYNGHYWFDTLLGTGGAFNIDRDNSSHSGTSLASGEDGISSFDSDGFTVDEAEETNFLADLYGNGAVTFAERYVAWCWKLGSTKTSGSSSWSGSGQDPDTEHYNSDAGISIINYYDGDGNGTSISINHSLGEAPEFAISMDYGDYTGGHHVWHKDLSANNYLDLSDNGAQSSDSSYFPSSPATNTTFTGGSSIVDSNTSHIVLFRSVEGFSKFGKYTGNASADGPFIYTGFRPAFVLIKPSSTSGSWLLFDNPRDSSNSMNNTLYPYSSTAESGSGEIIDFYSSGFKIRGNYTDINSNNDTKIYIAFAESPFKYANAR